MCSKTDELVRALSRLLAALVLAALALAAPVAFAQESGGAKPPAASPPPPPQPQTCEGVGDFFTTNCTLSKYGVQVYGTVDLGAGWMSHGTERDTKSPSGVEYLLSKNQTGSHWNLSPNALSQSTIGIRGSHDFAPGWAGIFLLEAGFDPYSFKLADGPGSISQQAGVPLNQQSANSDSSRAGQWYNSQGYIGVNSKDYGTLTMFRQNALTLDGVIAYDPMGASYAFSPIGYQGTTCGVGNTESCRFSTALKYRVNVGPVRLSALYQFGGYEQNNGSNGAYQLGAGGDITNLFGGTLALDGIYSYVRDSVGTSLAGNTLPATLPQVLTETISDNKSWMALARYTHGPVKAFGGYEWIDFSPPTDPQTSFSNISGNFVCLGCAGFNNTNINNTAFNFHDKRLQIVWTGVKYAVTDEVSLTGAYYQYIQNSFGATKCNNSSANTCSGAYHAASFVVDWQFAAKFDTYAGAMYQWAQAGLANGFLHRSTVDPTVGVRFRF